MSTLQKIKNCCIFLWLTIIGCTGNTSPQLDTALLSASTLPIVDMQSSSYMNIFTGGLYGQGNNIRPVISTQHGIEAARRITPRLTNGQPSPLGRSIVLSIGMSNMSQEWCGNYTQTATVPCTQWSFTNQSRLDTQRSRTIMIANGAMYSQTNLYWDSPTEVNYSIVASRLTNAGFSEQQVQVVFLKIANRQPATSLPAANADVYQLITSTGNIIRALRQRYPNLQMVYILTRTYAGYTTLRLSPEPFAYEGGFAVQHVVNASIHQDTTGIVDARAGDLSGVWIGWGPYYWTNGSTPRSDGFTWNRADTESDGIHPSTSGETKIASLLLTFMRTDATTCWYRTAGC